MATSVEMISAAPGAMLDSRWNATAAHALPTPASDRYNSNATTHQQQQCTAASSSSTSVPTPPPATSSKAETTSTHKSCTPGYLGDQEVDPLIVFDWDDTMLTSSWIQARDLLQAGSYDDLPECARRELAHLEHSVINCLTNARKLGTVIIITNAESGWVELSAAKFFVNLLPLLEGVPVISARSLFEAQFPGSPLCWKSAAFAYMMHDHFLDRPKWVEKRVISIGDSNEEKVAMRIASGQHYNMAAKAVKFITGPDPEALACQLDIVTANVESILFCDDDLDIVLSPSMISGAYALPMHARGVYDEPSAAPAGNTARATPDSTVSHNTPTPSPTTATAATVSVHQTQSNNGGQPPSAREGSTPPTAAQSQFRQVSPSIPIPIPGGTGARRVAEGGGDCVQPFSPSVGGGAFCSCSSADSTRSAAGLSMNSDCVNGTCGGGGGGGRSNVCGSGGGRACVSDELDGAAIKLGEGGIKGEDCGVNGVRVGDDGGVAGMVGVVGTNPPQVTAKPALAPMA